MYLCSRLSLLFPTDFFIAVLCSRVRFLQKNQCFGSVANIFYKVGCTAVSWTLLWCAHQCHGHCCDMHTIIIVTAVIGTPLSLTMLWHAHKYHWHHCDIHSGVINTLTRVQKSHFDSVWLNLTQCYSMLLNFTQFCSMFLNIAHSILFNLTQFWLPPFDKIWLYSTQI
jgi:hypothetical protein